YSGSNVRAAVTNDGLSFWTAGVDGSGGVWATSLGQTGGTPIATSPSNARAVGIFGGQLYVSSGMNPFTAVSTVGTGLPTPAGQLSTLLPGMPTTGASPNGFMLLDLLAGVPGVDTLYVADDRTAANGGGVQKWTFDGTTWALATTFTFAP